MYKIGRGLVIFDDYQNLPTISMMATGDIPPHFSLDPSLRFGYHYFLLLLSAQFVRLGDMYPFTALDLARALTFGLMIILLALWVRRVTRSRIAGWLAGMVMAFTGGMRWLLLLFPASLLDKIASQTQLMGSGLDTGKEFLKNLVSPWIIDGSGAPRTRPSRAGWRDPRSSASSGRGARWQDRDAGPARGEIPTSGCNN